MKKIKEFKIKSHSKISGKLNPLSFNKKFPIKVKRIFLLYGKKNKIRGNHAHKKCSQFFVPINGNASLTIRTDKTQKKILLKQASKKAILIPPNYWCSVKFFNKNSIYK